MNKKSSGKETYKSIDLPGCDTKVILQGGKPVGGTHAGDKSNSAVSTKPRLSGPSKVEKKLAKRIAAYEDVKNARHQQHKPGSKSGRK